MDLIAIDIQRERDVGLATLHHTRQALGLPRFQSFAEVTNDPVLQANLATVYGTVDNLDRFMGGLAEVHAPGAEVGPTFQAIIGRQFAALRDGDRFFWLNQGFDPVTAARIAATTLGDILVRNTDTVTVPVDVFVITNPPAHAPIRVPPAPVQNTHGRPPPAAP